GLWAVGARWRYCTCDFSFDQIVVGLAAARAGDGHVVIRNGDEFAPVAGPHVEIALPGEAGHDRLRLAVAMQIEQDGRRDSRSTPDVVREELVAPGHLTAFDV